MTIKIGVLALQGAFEAHKKHIEALGAEYREIRYDKDCGEVDAFILPGGESSTMLRLIRTFDLEKKLKEEFAKKPVWGICAGSILIASKVTNPEQKCFKLMNYTAERNAYGRQLDSHNREIDGYNISFIRAPVFCDVDDSIEIIAEHDGTPTWIKQGKYMASSFHAELNSKTPSPMHKAFYEIILASKK